MSIGDLVNVTESLGCHIPPRHFRCHGIGVILEITEVPGIVYPGLGYIAMSDAVTVSLATGRVADFHVKDIEVISESR